MSNPRTKRVGKTLNANSETIRREHDLKIQATKGLLAEWVEDNRGPGDGGTIILALLELGIEHHLDNFGERSAADLVHGVLRKVVQRRLGPLQ